MARILLDACVPRWIRHELTGHEVETARMAGLSDLPDGEMLAEMEGRFQILVTLDRGIPYQQNLRNRSIAIVILIVRSQAKENFKRLIPSLQDSIGRAKPGSLETIRE